MKRVLAALVMLLFFGAMLRLDQLKSFQVTPTPSIPHIAPKVTQASKDFGALKEPAAVGLKPERSTPISNLAPIILEYRNSKRDRLFVLQAWRRPDEGGQLYASFIVRKCATILMATSLMAAGQPETAAVGAEHYADALSALRGLQSECGQFSSQELVEYSTASILKSGNADGDKFVTLAAQYNSTQGGEHEKVLEDVLKTQDPVLLEELGTRLITHREGNITYYYFNGQRFNVDQHPEVAQAVYLLPCAIGLVCDASDPDLAMGCALSGECFSSRFEKVRQNLSGQDRIAYADVMAVYENMATALKMHDASKFFETQADPVRQ